MTIQELKILKTRLPLCPGIQAKEQYFHSAVLIPIVVKEDECYVLFQKRTNHIRQGGEICFPGGQYEPEHDKNYQETAIREAIEELGIERQQIQLIGRLDLVVSPQALIVAPFLAILAIESLNELSLDANEVESVFLIPMSYFEKNVPDEYCARVEIQPSYIDPQGHEHILLPAETLGLPERYHQPWGGRMHRVLVYQSPEEIIWGITAGIMYDLVQKLRIGGKL